jgi:hypothetical protein
MSEDAQARPTRNAPEPLYDVRIPAPTHAWRTKGTYYADFRDFTLWKLGF